jgi:hypothetical protein
MPKDHSAVGVKHAWHTIQLLVPSMVFACARARTWIPVEWSTSLGAKLVAGCTRTKQTTWIEDQFTVTSSAGIRNREKRVADIVVRELIRAKPGVWGCIQADFFFVVLRTPQRIRRFACLTRRVGTGRVRAQKHDLCCHTHFDTSVLIEFIMNRWSERY